MVNNQNSKKTKFFLVCGVLLLAVVSASWAISEDTLDNHECFVSVTAREMLASGDWVWPTFNGQSRIVKTPLSYWLVAGLAKITGRVDELTARLPSVIFAVLSVGAILYFVNYCVSFRTSLICAGVWATSLDYIRHAHNARPEMVMTSFIVLALLSFYSAVITQRRKRQIAYALVFWFSFALSNLAKGPMPLPLVLIPVFFYIAIFRKWKVLPRLLPIIGPLIFLGIVLPWPLVIAHKLNWNLALWRLQFVDRFLGQYASGNKQWYYYLPTMFLFIIPWVVFLPMALAAPFYRVWNKKRPLMQFLWLWFVVDIVFLTISGGKRQHYILPSMPAMAILIGIVIEDMVFIRKAYSLRFAKTVLAGHAAGVIALAVAGSAYLIKVYPNMITEALILGTVTIILAVAVVVLFASGKPAFACGTLFGGIIMLVMVGYVTFLNPLDYNRYSRDFSKKLAQIVPQSDNLIAYEYISNRSVHYFGRVIPEITDKSVLYERYEQGDWVVATADRLEKLQTDGGLRMVYYKQKAERKGQDDAPGALLHKSAPIVTKEP
jgi:4-amino-4-deoxy-L-arabinose transferase-like glycosyltransferase